MNPLTTIADAIDKTHDRFSAIAPQFMKFEAERSFAIQIAKTNTFLATAAAESPESMQSAIVNVASIGLSLNPAEKLAYLITRTVKVGQKAWKTKVFLEPSYMGLCKLATDSGSIHWVQANCVYSKDTFVDNGPGNRPTHTYNAFASREQRGDFIGAYCVAKESHGDYLTTTMNAEEIFGIMERSEAVKAYRQGKGSGGPWMSDFSEQAKKTVVRRAFKMWPRSNGRMAAAVDLSNDNEGFEPILTTPAAGQFTADQKQYFDQIIEKNDALAMHFFVASIEETVFINLYHSFPKGEKGKYQKMVNALTEKGRSLAEDYQNAIEDAAARDDQLAYAEIAEEIGADIKHLKLSQQATEFCAQAEAA